MRMACMLAILLTALLAPCARAATPPTHVTGKLLADTSAIQPGATFTLAVTLTIDPDWHIYWTNPGDSGTPTQITFDLPTGFTAAPVQFPLPIQFNQPGDIVGYGYRNAATFTARITASSELPLGQNFTLKARVSWLCCKDVCIPGSTTLDITLPSADQPTPANAALFKQAAAAMPIAAADDPNFAGKMIAMKPIADHSATDVSLSLQWKAPPVKVEVFPTAVDNLEISALKISAPAFHTQISFTVRLLAAQKLKSSDLPLLIVYIDREGVRHGFFLAPQLAVDTSLLSSPHEFETATH